MYLQLRNKPVWDILVIFRKRPGNVIFFPRAYVGNLFQPFRKKSLYKPASFALS